MAASGPPLAAQSAPREIPGVCAEGRISRIEVDNRSVLPEASEVSDLVRWGFRLANRLHVRTRPGFIRGELLFAEGDCFDPLLMAESQRLLERLSFIAGARVVAEDDGAGGKRVRVETRDEWTTKVDVGVTYDEGLNLETLQFTERNFLGRGLFVEGIRRQRLEQRSRVFGLGVPSLVGRTSAGLRFASARDGHSFAESLSHPFAGDVGRLSAREGFSRGTALFAYATDDQEAFSHALVPVRQDALEIAAATRFGDPAASLILGASLTREAFVPRGVEIAFGGAFDERAPPAAPLPNALARQLRPLAATRVAAHVGMRHYRYATYRGLDAVREEQTVGLGFLVGGTLGKSVPVLTPAGAPAVKDLFARLHGSMGVAAGPLLLHGGTTVEARREGSAWSDVIAEADLVAYLQGRFLPGQVVFARASAAGGWRTTSPYQLTLGGREGVRSLGNDRFPGGRQLLFVLEDRLRFGWTPGKAVDLGATIFGDWGRMWPGDAPYGTDSGWRGAAGFGLRVAIPSASRNIWRPDLVFPVGPGAGGGPIFRVTFELNRMRTGFFTPDAARSRRFNLGPDRF